MFYIQSLLLGLGITQLLVNAQLSPDPLWRKPRVTITKKQRIDIAANALDAAVTTLDSELLLSGTNDTLAMTAQLFTHLSLFDELSNQTRYKDKVMDYFQLRGYGGLSNVSGTPRGIAEPFTNVDYFLLYGISALQAQQSYSGSIYTNASSIGSDRIPRRYSTNLVDAVCLNASTLSSYIGGALVDGFGNTHNPETPSFKTYTNSLWLRLNALDYAQRFLPISSGYAERSANVLGKLGNGLTDLGWEKGCESTTTVTDPHEGVQALCLEGLSTYSQATNKFEEQRLREIIFSTVKSWGEETFPNYAYPGESPGSFLSNLASAYRRLPFEDMHSYLEGFISTQYNAVVDNITSTDNFYGNWPADSGTSLQRQLSDCYTLVAGLSLPEVSHPDPTTSPTITSSSSPTSDEAFGNKETNVGAIVGGLSAGVITVGLTLLACVFWVRRRRKRQQQLMAPPSIEPFTLRVEDKGQGFTQSQQRPPGKLSAYNSVSQAEKFLDASTRNSTSMNTVHERDQESVNPGDVQGAIEEHERHQDSGWRPDRRLPPTYEDAV